MSTAATSHYISSGGEKNRRLL